MTFEILTMATCRWSVRNIVALMEKEADFQLVDVMESGRKAPWYSELTPFGKTPALRHAQHIVVESRVINEYIEETAPGRSLLPSDPLERAWARIWNGYCDEEIMRHVSLLATAEPSARQRALADLDAAFARLETHLFLHAQPGVFWGGAKPSLTDICYWSLFDVLQRVDVLQPARRLLEARRRVAEWSRNVLAHPAFFEAMSRLEGLPSGARH
jgi:glutathione S-transferase